MTTPNLPAEFLERLKRVTGKRSRIVVDHILEHGFIATDELEQIYGYMHPPRAVRDVREQGIPIETYRIRVFRRTQYCSISLWQSIRGQRGAVRT